MKKMLMVTLMVSILVFSFGIGSAIAEEEVEVEEEEITLEESLTGVEVAIGSVRDSAIDEGYSPEEAREIALTALEGIRDGLRGEDLALAVREVAQKESQIGEQTQLEAREIGASAIPEDVKDFMNQQERIQEIREEWEKDHPDEKPPWVNNEIR